jgi:1-acyl-sn-glycerol-3-phosphate acyltransferase
MQPTASKRKCRPREKSRLLQWFHPDGVDWGDHPEDYDPAAVDEARRWAGMVFGPQRYFRVEVAGWHNIPEAPVMFVSNHSGGSLFLDSWGLLYAWYTHFGTERSIHPAVHEMLLGNPVTGPFLSKWGAVRADRDLAQRVIEEWRDDLLVMPGGDLDVWRPFSKRYKVQFAGRKGYARIALNAGVSVVPVANAGAHETFVVLSDGEKLANFLRLPLIARSHVWPVHLSLPWGLAIGPWPHFPVRAKLRYRFGEPIHPREVGMTPGRAPSEEQVEAFDEKTRAGVQRQLDLLRDER